MLSITLIYIIGVLEKTSFFFLNKTNKLQEIQIILSTFLLSIILFIISYFYYGNIDISFLTDYRVYFSFILEIISFKLSKFNYQNQKNFISISFTQMTSIWLIFPVSYFLDSILTYDKSIIFEYDNNYQIFLYTILFFITTIFYFYDKLKLKDINHPIALFSLGLSLTFSMYFAVKNLQTFQPTSVFAIIVLLISFIYLFDFKNNKNKLLLLRLSFKRKYLINYIKYFISYILTVLLSIYVILFINVEFITIFKRNGQLIASNIFDYFKTKKIPILKDRIIVIFILVFSLIIYNY
jgi:hypothetical protein